MSVENFLTTAKKPELKSDKETCTSPLFSELKPAEHAEFLATAQRFHREKGELIYREGMPAEGIYLICSGKVKLVGQTPDRRKTYILEILGPGELLGEEAFFANIEYNVDARAMEATELCFFERADFLSLLHRHHSVTLKILEKLSREIKALQMALVEIVYEGAEGRLARALLKLGRKYGIREGQSRVIDLGLSRIELAEFLGLRPETTSRILSRWRAQGILMVQGRRLIILDEDCLVKFARPPRKWAS